MMRRVMTLGMIPMELRWAMMVLSVVRALALFELLTVCPHSGRDLAEDLLQPHLVARQPLDVIERFHVDEAVRSERRQCVQGVVSSVREVSCDSSRDLVSLEEVHHLVALPFEIWVHLPDGRESVQVLRVVLAQEVDDEVNAVRRLLLFDLLCEPCEQQRYG